AAHTEAKEQANHKDALLLSNVPPLFDTGESSGNFVSKAFIEKHGLQDQLLKVNKKVKVANGTKVEIHAKIMLFIEFETEGRPTSAILEFWVMEGLSLDLIIGLPAICNHFNEVLCDMMGKAIFNQHDNGSIPDLNQIEPTNLIKRDILSSEPVQPWSYSDSFVMSEEENMIPEPGSNISGQFTAEEVKAAR
ncbi:MAG: retropepsin-like aspartic protease, partial [bacterium]